MKTALDIEKASSIIGDYLMEKRDMDYEVREAIRTLYITCIPKRNGNAA